ncbi:HEAT repeat protein [Symmachiella dynata]|uniref:HEAT repeat protein n=1 Tax=Symmachiella dynata TaxID=2527995 RepID=A0A517ZX50_9PLAN|nr:HEAT repeat domain-containing protein [Symmachiella dynata]QDU47052.1 HEAT repeat protein [Symmachiella dynata]
MKAKPAIPSLIELYRSTLDEHEAQETFLAIGPAALDGLVESFRGQTASPQIIRAIERFGRQAEETIPDLIVSMNDDDPETRQSIANALGSIRRNPTICLPALGRLLNDPHVAVRATAAKSIGRFGRAAISAVPQLRAALSDDFVDVRVAAISALWNIGATDIETQQAVAKRVTDAHPLVQLVAKEWMEKFGSP